MHEDLAGLVVEEGLRPVIQGRQAVDANDITTPGGFAVDLCRVRNACTDPRMELIESDRRDLRSASREYESPKSRDTLHEGIPKRSAKRSAAL